MSLICESKSGFFYGLFTGEISTLVSSHPVPQVTYDQFTVVLLNRLDLSPLNKP